MPSCRHQPIFTRSKRTEIVLLLLEAALTRSQCASEVGGGNAIISGIMFGFGRFGRVRQRTRRFLAAVGAAFLLGFQVFSAAYVAHETDHDCCGDGCPVCVQLQQCVANFQLAGSGLPSEPPHIGIPPTFEGIAPVADVEWPSLTLVSFKVRFND